MQGKKTGGRSKGIPNKKSQSLIELCESLDVRPFEILLNFAKADWEALGYSFSTRTIRTKSGESFEEDIITPDMRVNAAKEVCQYLYPKRKSLEHSGNLDPKIIEAAEDIAGMNKQEKIQTLEDELRKLKGE